MGKSARYIARLMAADDDDRFEHVRRGRVQTEVAPE